MKIVSWNVNGLRACIKKGFAESIREVNPDIFCLQEIKLSDFAPVERELDALCAEYPYRYWNPASIRKGYSGTAILSKVEPARTSLGMPTSVECENPWSDDEGRIITADYGSFFLVTIYTPNSQDGLRRLPLRLSFEELLRGYLMELDAKKPVIICGDLNVAHNEIDLKNPSSNHMNAGFSDAERAAFSHLLDAGFADTFRTLYPDKRDAYTWWSFITNARSRNSGWRIDYFVVSNRLLPKVRDSIILADIYGSDHCPVALDIDL
ncbi:MAG: exodeoxyribonuclease III [Oscillospiraceae bacterium]|jgi:exodeoxyribonuclease-3|nr:exodeoxyribonuclease III [Oscillospiraceae bacterium]